MVPLYADDHPLLQVIADKDKAAMLRFAIARIRDAGIDDTKVYRCETAAGHCVMLERSNGPTIYVSLVDGKLYDKEPEKRIRKRRPNPMKKTNWFSVGKRMTK